MYFVSKNLNASWGVQGGTGGNDSGQRIINWRKSGSATGQQYNIAPQLFPAI